MSLLSRDQVRISLAPHQVALVRLRRGVRGGIADRKVLTVDGFTNSEAPIAVFDDGDHDSTAAANVPSNEVLATNGTGANSSGSDGASSNGGGSNAVSSNWSDTNWRGAVEVLREMLAHPNVGRGALGRVDASLVLSNHYARYLVLPWSPALVTSAEEAEFARMRFVQVFGEAANQWRVMLSPAPAGNARVAAAIDEDLLDAIGQSLSGSPLRLHSVQPALMSQFNAWRRQIGDDAWLVMAERGRALIAWIHRGEWRSIRTRPVGAAPLPLSQWLAQERLLLDAPADAAKVCLSVVDDVAVDTDGVRVQMLSPRARNGFVPRTDGSLLLAMAGAV